jgi:hypothetical protein
MQTLHKTEGRSWSDEFKCKKQFLPGEFLEMMISIELLNLFSQTQVNWSVIKMWSMLGVSSIQGAHDNDGPRLERDYNYTRKII